MKQYQHKTCIKHEHKYKNKKRNVIRQGNEDKKGIKVTIISYIHSLLNLAKLTKKCVLLNFHVNSILNKLKKREETNE